MNAVDLEVKLMEVAADRHPGTKHIIGLFRFAHLSGLRQFTSRECALLALSMLGEHEDGPELTVGLRKLLEAKDCFVRCVTD